MTSVVGLVTRKDSSHSGPLLNPAGKSVRAAVNNDRPLVMFLVIGETARAANFSLGGYSRTTNPELERVSDLIYFDHVTSCATATAISLPCIFSGSARERFDVDEAPRYANLLDAVGDADSDVLTRCRAHSEHRTT